MKTIQPTISKLQPNLQPLYKRLSRVLLTALLLMASLSAAAAISVSVDRQQIIADEAFQLTFTSDQKVAAAADFSSLNQAFTIVNTSTNNMINITNGAVTHSQQWNLTLIANQAGTFTIPPIQFGNDVSPAQSIKVLAAAPDTADATADTAADTADAAVDIAVSTPSPYVQEQVLVTVKLYLNPTVRMNNHSLSAPTVSGGQAIIELAREDKQYQQHRNGINYQVIERQYRLFPQNSGALKIEPILFQAQRGAGGFFNLGAQQQTIVKRSEAVELSVKPIPETFPGKTWLPARALSINTQWSTPPEQLQQNQAATRTQTLQATGLTASQLPLIDSQIPEAFKQYPDQPAFENTPHPSGADIIGKRSDKTAIIPTMHGDFTLPTIQIPWWNTATDTLEFAELPSRVLHVNAAINADNTTPQQQSPQQSPDSQALNGATTTVKPLDKSGINDPQNNASYWQWLSLALFILWLSTLLLMSRHRHQQTAAADSRQPHHASTAAHIKRIKQACHNNNPQLAQAALLQWAKSNWRDQTIINLRILSVKADSDPAFQQQLDDLNQHLYGQASHQTQPQTPHQTPHQHQSEWQGAEFFNCFAAQFLSAKPDKPTPPSASGQLETLYKTLKGGMARCL